MFIEGADYAIKIINEQCYECLKCNVVPSFPNHMTRWWLTTQLYDNSPTSLETVHYYHIAFKRPDIIEYLALPIGFHFLFGQKSKI